MDEEEKLTLTMAEYKKLTDVEANMVLTNNPKLYDGSDASDDEESIDSKMISE